MESPRGTGRWLSRTFAERTGTSVRRGIFSQHGFQPTWNDVAMPAPRPRSELTSLPRRASMTACIARGRVCSDSCYAEANSADGFCQFGGHANEVEMLDAVRDGCTARLWRQDAKPYRRPALFGHQNEPDVQGHHFN